MLGTYGAVQTDFRGREVMYILMILKQPGSLTDGKITQLRATCMKLIWKTKRCFGKLRTQSLYISY